MAFKANLPNNSAVSACYKIVLMFHVQTELQVSNWVNKIVFESKNNRDNYQLPIF